MAVALALAATPGASAADRPSPRAAAVEIEAMSADDVVDSYGVGIHLNFLDTPYRDTDAVLRALTDLGVRHVRDDLYLDAPRQYAAIAKVAEQGIGFNLIMGRPGVGTPQDYVDVVANRLPPGAVESIEGANEWDLFGPDDPAEWVPQVLDWQQRLWAAAKANPATEQLPVLSPALAFRWNYAQVGDLSPWADIANAHMYPGGYQPSNEITRITRAVRESLPDEPLVTTEAGYHNAVNNTGSNPGVPEDVAGAYLPRLLLEHVARGEQRMYSYELIDSFDDPDQTNPEANFGLLNYDLSPKPAYTAMKRLLALLADPGPAFDPATLSIAATGLPADTRYLLTQKRDGRFVLLLWRDVSIFDPVTQQPIPVEPADATLSFDSPRAFTVYRPSTSAEPVARRTATELPLRLAGEVLAIEIAPPAPDPEPELVPTAPTISSVKPGVKRVTVRWAAAAGRGNPVTAYRLTVRGRTIALGPDALRKTITGLPAGKRLRVGVRAQNAIGWGAIAWTRYVRTR
ncbi:fibronectin type III domain-containing protein [Nocardioides hungaricus]